MITNRCDKPLADKLLKFLEVEFPKRVFVLRKVETSVKITRKRKFFLAVSLPCGTVASKYVEAFSAEDAVTDYHAERNAGVYPVSVGVYPTADAFFERRTPLYEWKF